MTASVPLVTAAGLEPWPSALTCFGGVGARPLAAAAPRCTRRAREEGAGPGRSFSRDGGGLAALPAGAASRERTRGGADAGAGAGLTAVGPDG